MTFQTLIKPSWLYFPGCDSKDANPDIGGSVTSETAGLGGLAMTAASDITKFVGGISPIAYETTPEMYEVTFDEVKPCTIPALNLRGTPFGIELRCAMDNGILPKIHIGGAHKKSGVCLVGDGTLRAPIEPFKLAFGAGEAQ